LNALKCINWERRVDKDADGIVTEEEIKEIISLSATSNELLNIKNQAGEYAALIMEELDRKDKGFIMVIITYKIR